MVPSYLEICSCIRQTDRDDQSVSQLVHESDRQTVIQSVGQSVSRSVRQGITISNRSIIVREFSLSPSQTISLIRKKHSGAKVENATHYCQNIYFFFISVL